MHTNIISRYYCWSIHISTPGSWDANTTQGKHIFILILWYHYKLNIDNKLTAKQAASTNWLWLLVKHRKVQFIKSINWEGQIWACWLLFINMYDRFIRVYWSIFNGCHTLQDLPLATPLNSTIVDVPFQEPDGSVVEVIKSCPCQLIEPFII